MTAHLRNSAEISVDDMVEHIIDLCERHQIDVELEPPGRAWACHEMSVIGIPVVRTAKTYATALHEIGHILGAHQRSRSVMVCERWAWRWAKRNARVWTPTMERRMCFCLAWYEANEKTQQAAHEAAMFRAAESQRGLLERWAPTQPPETQAAGAPLQAPADATATY